MSATAISVCPTPHKRPYSTKRAAKQDRRRFPHLKPYECPCGEHWHLTSGRQRKRPQAPGGAA